jgi:hypothetical protein
MKHLILVIFGGLVLVSLTRPSPSPAQPLRHVGENIEEYLSLSESQKAIMAIFAVVQDQLPEIGVIEVVKGADGVVKETDEVVEAVNPDDMSLRHPQSLSPVEIDAILAEYGSPAGGTGKLFYDLGVEYDIDAAYAVAFFIHESTAGTAQTWAGLKPGGATTHNIGNIICAGYPTCYGRFRDYPSWEAGIQDWYRLIDVEYIKGRGHQTVADVIPVYAPKFENDVGRYTNVIEETVAGWRKAKAPISELVSVEPMDVIGPTLCPVVVTDPALAVYMTQGYGVGSHAPANIWGAVDLAVGLRSQGFANPSSSQGAKLVATHSGHVVATPNSYPGGNHVFVQGEGGWKTGYAHLETISVTTGQFVQAGDQIGTLGNTGMSSGPHLDYQLWKDKVNIDPTPNVQSCFP